MFLYTVYPMEKGTGWKDIELVYGKSLEVTIRSRFLAPCNEKAFFTGFGLAQSNYRGIESEYWQRKEGFYERKKEKRPGGAA